MNIFGEITSDLIPLVAAEIEAIKAEAALGAFRTSYHMKIVISSPGGDAFAGLAIYDMLRNSGLKIRTEIVGICASAASTIALAGDERAMGEHSMLMLHPAWVNIAGNAAELREKASVLESISQRMADIAASACSPEAQAQIGAMTEREVWLSADEAMKAGLATEITNPAAVAASMENDMNLKAQFLAFLSGKTEDEIKAFLDAKAEAPAEDGKALAMSAELEALKAEKAALEAKISAMEDGDKEDEKEEEELAKARAEVISAMKDGLTIASAELAISAKTPTEIRAAISAGERLPKASAIPQGNAPADILAEYQGMADPVKRAAYFAKNMKTITEAQKQR